MEIVNFIRRDNDYLPAEPKEGTFYWLADNSIWFAPYSEIDESEENGGLIRVDNNLDIDGVKEIVDSLNKADISYVDEEILKIHNELESLIESSEFENKLNELRTELIGVIENAFDELATKEYVDEKISEYKLKWRVIM